MSAPVPARRSHTRGYVIATILTLAMVAGLYLLIHNIADRANHPLNTLNPQGQESHRIQDLALPVLAVAGLVFVLVEGAIIFLIFRFRRRHDDVDGEAEPVQIHGKSALEWTWTAVPALILLVLAVFNVQTIWNLESDADAAKMSVTVVGQQWWWEFRYDVDNDGKPDIITANQLVLPVKTLVAMHIQSNDVIHSFWIPALNGKKDAVPGRTQRIALHADRPGIYEGQCTEFCGLSHAYMRMQVKALSKADFATWEQNQLRGPVEPDDGTMAADGRAIVEQKCLGCHQINGTDPSGKRLDSNRPDPDYNGANQPLISGNAPNLTHLMSREHFAGGMFNLYDHYDAGHGPETVDPQGSVNQGELGDWLRNPPGKKPMAADRARGMPNLNLTDDEIGKIVSYLSTLK
jgi:cytochrome c oxidase subunit 2